MMPFLFTKADNNQILEIETESIEPSASQPRKVFSERSLAELAESIKEHGVLQPLLVTKNGDGYTVIAGERRLRAAKMAGVRTVPAILLTKDSKECAEISLIENIQREQLSFFEEAEGYRRLCDEFNMSQAEIAKRLAKKQSTVSNKLRLLRLPKTAQAIISANGLTERHARELLRITDKHLMFAALDHIITKKLNVRETELYITSVLQPKPTPPQRSFKVKDVRIFVNTITKAVNLIKQSGIKPVTELNETDGFVEYIIKIPKTS